MRLDLFFTIFAIPAGICALMLGDSANLVFKAAVETEGSAVIFFIIVSALATVSVIFANLAYAIEYYDSTEDYRKQFGKGLTIIAAAFFGLFLFSILVGPINNGSRAWFDGWAFIALAAILPALLNLNTLIQEARENHRTSKDRGSHHDGVTPIHNRQK